MHTYTILSARPPTYLDLSGVDNCVNLPINQIIKHGWLATFMDSNINEREYSFVKIEIINTNYCLPDYPNSLGDAESAIHVYN